MKYSVLLVATLFSLGAAVPSAFAHDEESRVAIEKDDGASVQAGKFELTFQLIDLENKTILKDVDLRVMHEKKLHFFVFDPALKEFRHEHPEFRNERWHVTLDLPVNGNYWIWAQGEIAADGEEFAGSERLVVTNGTPANPSTPQLGDSRTGTDSLSKAVLSGGRLVAKRATMLTLTLSRTDGSQPEITPYLGALAHFVIVSEDGDTFIHAHPMEMAGSTQLMVHTTFPRAGDFRVWVQFVDAGVLKTVPLSVTVFAR